MIRLSQEAANNKLLQEQYPNVMEMRFYVINGNLKDVNRLYTKLGQQLLYKIDYFFKVPLFFLCAHISNQKQCITFLNYFIERNIPIMKQYFSNYLICYLVEMGCKKAIEFLLEKKMFDINFKNHKNQNLLIIAAKYNHINIVKFLINRGISLNNFDSYNMNALLHALKQGNFEVIKFLINCGFSLKINYKQNQDIFYYCNLYGQTELIQYFKRINPQNKQFHRIYITKGSKMVPLDQNCEPTIFEKVHQVINTPYCQLQKQKIWQLKAMKAIDECLCMKFSYIQDSKNTKKQTNKLHNIRIKLRNNLYESQKLLKLDLRNLITNLIGTYDEIDQIKQNLEEIKDILDSYNLWIKI